MWHDYFQHMLIKRCDNIHVYVDCMPVVGVKQELFLLQGVMMHTLCSISVISEVSVFSGLTTAGSSAPQRHLLSLPCWDGGEALRVNVTKVVG